MNEGSSCPTVSVVMPAYNVHRYVREAVESILTQTFREFELIVIDDGSTDETKEILGMLAERDARIRLVSRENRGLGATRNEGVSLARGEFIAIMDADDVAMPERFAKEVAFLRDHPDHVCVGTWSRLIDAKGRWIPYPDLEWLDDAAIQATLLRGISAFWASSVMTRRDAVLQVGGFDTKLLIADDYDMWLKLGEVGKLANLPEELVCYRIHASQLSQNIAQVQAESRLAWERAVARRNVSSIYQEGLLNRWTDHQSQWNHPLELGGWALYGGAPRTALAFGMQAIKARPLDYRGWQLTARSLKSIFEKFKERR